MTQPQLPSTDVQRKILEAKRDKFRAQGYELQVNAVLARRGGHSEKADEMDILAAVQYSYAEHCCDLLDALLPSAQG